MDKIQIYNYLNRVKPFFKRQQEQSTVSITGGAVVTQHHDILVYTSGGVYKFKDIVDNKTGGNDINNKDIEIDL